MQSERGQVLIIANFDQKFFSGTQSGGHFAPIGAYDAERKRVLLMAAFKAAKNSQVNRFAGAA